MAAVSKLTCTLDDRILPLQNLAAMNEWMHFLHVALNVFCVRVTDASPPKHWQKYSREINHTITQDLACQRQSFEFPFLMQCQHVRPACKAIQLRMRKTDIQKKSLQHGGDSCIEFIIYNTYNKDLYSDEHVCYDLNGLHYIIFILKYSLATTTTCPPRVFSKFASHIASVNKWPHLYIEVCCGRAGVLPVSTVHVFPVAVRWWRASLAMWPPQPH